MQTVAVEDTGVRKEPEDDEACLVLRDRGGGLGGRCGASKSQARRDVCI